MNSISGASFSDSKKHFLVLDGLRGVAAVMVVLFHLLEIFSGGNHAQQLINHGYLAVDFFYLLSGFVIGYAYDERWNKMTLKGFFKRRLIRLHPMIIVGSVIGAITFYFQGGVMFPMIDDVPLKELIMVMIVGCTLLPLPPSMDVRGWIEMHPLNGPAWSLFFEYIANILYALFLRRLSNTVLMILAVITGGLLIHMAVTHGDLIGGWSLIPEQLRIGFTRLLFPFIAGILLSRMVKPGSIQFAFLICSLLLIVSFSLPWIGSHEVKWMNGLYDALAVIILFPIIVVLGASGSVYGLGEKVCKFLGDISYPIYITHFPFIYLFMAWVTNNQVSMTDAAPAAALVFVVTILVAYASFKWYDLPVRKWLTTKWMKG